MTSQSLAGTLHIDYGRLKQCAIDLTIPVPLYLNSISYMQSLRIHISPIKIRYIKSILTDLLVELKQPKTIDFENMCRLFKYVMKL